MSGKPIDIGAVSEHRFAAELLARGAMPSWPSSQQQPYDLIVDVPSGRYRVQVKGTESKLSTIEFKFRCRDGNDQVPVRAKTRQRDERPRCLDESPRCRPLVQKRDRSWRRQAVEIFADPPRRD